MNEAKNVKDSAKLLYFLYLNLSNYKKLDLDIVKNNIELFSKKELKVNSLDLFMGDDFIRSQNDRKFNSFLPNDLFISEEYLSPFNNGLIKETYVNDEVYNYFSFFIKKREDIKFYFALSYYNKGIALKDPQLFKCVHFFDA